MTNDHLPSKLNQCPKAHVHIPLHIKSRDYSVTSTTNDETCMKKTTQMIGDHHLKPAPKQMHLKPNAIDYTIQNAVRAKIRFNEDVRIKSVRHFNDYPLDVIEAYWMTQEEMDEIRDKAQRLVDFADRYPDMIDELGGIYGLEKHTRALAIAKNDIRKRSVGTVLEIQSRNKTPLVAVRRFDPETFAAKMYFLQSAKATVDARVHAYELHNEVANRSNQL
jgi:hypothetical protein